MPSSLMVILVTLLLAPHAQAAGYRVASVPAWVQPVVLPPPASPADKERGQRWLLTDRQERIGAHRAERYVHSARQITDESGLQDATQIQIGFDPTYESVLLHGVTVLRGGVRLNRLRPSAIKVAQREPNLEAEMYDGLKSLVLFLEDVRVGDVIELQYTIVGADPTLDGHVSEELLLGVPAPVGRIHARVVVPAGYALHHREDGPDATTLTPVVTRTPLGDEYVWDIVDARAYPLDGNAPSWFHALPATYLSDFASWAEVAAWATRLIHTTATPSRALVQQAQALSRQSHSPSEFVMQTTRFVQDQVRYVALETGLSRRRSTDPAVVLARRFGDCKDKSVLLATLLRLGGVEAEPALVSTSLGEHLDEALPSASTFDHVIVRVRPGSIGTRYLWIDPTITLQGGALERAHASRFGRALVLAPGTAELSKLPPEGPASATVSARDRYDVPKPGASEPMRLTAVREYHGLVADGVRHVLRAASREQTAKQYLQTYSRLFPSVETSAPFEVNDDREHDFVRLEFHYTIRAPWKWLEAHHRWEFEVGPTLLADYLEKPEVAARTAPLGTVHPTQVTTTIDLLMPQNWPIKAEEKQVHGPAFDFTFSVNAVERDLHYEYAFTTTSDSVDVARLARHAEAVDQAAHQLRRAVSWVPLGTGINVWAWLALLSTLAACAVAAPRVYRYRAAPPVPDGLPLQPLNGWLALVGLRVCSLPLLGLWQLAKTRWFFARAGWQSYMDPARATYHPAMGLLVMAEVIVMTVITSYALLVAHAFVKRRASFPFHFTMLTATVVLYNGFDDQAVGFLDPKRAGAGLLARLIVQAGIAWLFVRYVLKSPQARRTFTQP